MNHPEVFETLTKEWINKTPKRRRRRTSKSETANDAVSTGESMASADRVDDASIANTGIAANSMIANGLIDNELSMN